MMPPAPVSDNPQPRVACRPRPPRRRRPRPICAAATRGNGTAGHRRVL